MTKWSRHESVERIRTRDAAVIWPAGLAISMEQLLLLPVWAALPAGGKKVWATNTVIMPEVLAGQPVQRAHWSTVQSPWLWKTRYQRWRMTHFLCLASLKDFSNPCTLWKSCWWSWSVLLWKFGHAPMSIWTIQIELSGLGVVLGGTRVGGWTWKAWEASVIRVPCMKFPNN